MIYIGGGDVTGVWVGGQALKRSRLRTRLKRFGGRVERYSSTVHFLIMHRVWVGTMLGRPNMCTFVYNV
jgi:hypothetical protein